MCVARTVCADTMQCIDHAANTIDVHLNSYFMSFCVYVNQIIKLPPDLCCVVFGIIDCLLTFSPLLPCFILRFGVLLAVVYNYTEFKSKQLVIFIKY